MHNKKVFIWMTGVCALLISLIVIQLLWMRNARQVEERQLALQVQQALRSMEKNIRDANTCVNFFTKAYLNGGEGFYIIKQQWDKTGYTGETDTINVFYDYNGYILKNGKPKREIPYKFPDVKTGVPAYAEISVNLMYRLDDTTGFGNEKDAAYTGLNRYNFKERMTNNQPIQQVYEMEFVDSLIADQLAKEHIPYSYGFAFINNNNGPVEYAARIEDSSALLRTPFKASLFSEDRFLKPYTLALAFNARPRFYTINKWLIVSIGIILILTVSFYAFVRLFLLQNKLSEMKSEFINNLTHEFNTPMANISLAIETLEEDKKDHGIVLNKALGIIASESERLRENIERALHVASLEKGKLALRKENIDLLSMINTIEATYQMQCEQLGGRISIHYKGEAFVFGDETHLLNCVCNLLDNAIKYRKDAPVITITVSEKENSILLQVEDNGIGMSPETQKHIFDKFYRAPQGDRHDTKGFGLGLNYVKRIIEEHGGKITVTSKPGAGSRFVITLPKVKNA